MSQLDAHSHTSSVAAAMAGFTTWVAELGLLSLDEVAQARWLLSPEFPFAAAVSVADNVHLHVKVDDVAVLPHQPIRDLGMVAENATDGYVKYRGRGGVNLIFSSIPVAADDLVPGAVTAARPFLYHAGADIRAQDPTARAVFDAIPGRAALSGWRRVSQDGPVRCCHTEVAAKHWAYPPAQLRGWRRPLEVAFGPLTISAATVGCDLRPMDPTHPFADAPGCCADSPDAR